MNRNKLLQTIVISLFSVAFASLSAASEGSYRLISATKAYQLSFNQLEYVYYESTESHNSFLKLGLNENQQGAFKELLDGQTGASLGIVFNDIWIRTLNIRTPEIGGTILFSLTDDIKPPYPTAETRDTLLQFVIKEEFSLPSEYRLPTVTTDSFKIVLKKDVLNRLCASPNIYLFEKDMLTAQSVLCEDGAITLKFTK